MDSSEKTVLVVGGAAIVGFLLLGVLKQRAATAAAYANEPGLNYQPPVPTYQDTAQQTFANILGSASGAFSNWLGSGFSSSIGGSNSPGLEDDSYEQSDDQLNTSGGTSFDDSYDDGPDLFGDDSSDETYFA